MARKTIDPSDLPCFRAQQ